MSKKSVTSKYSDEEWLDSDGRLRLPFVPDDIKETDTSEYFGEYKVLYELTGLSHCNALEESLRREDFAGEYFKRYMTESENIPEYYEGMGEENFQLYSSGAQKTGTLNMLEVILAQPEAYAQLTNSQRETLVRRVIEKEKLGEQGKLFYSDVKYYKTFFFACIAGELYLPEDMAAIPYAAGYLSGTAGVILREDNPWLDTIKELDLTEDEQKVIEKYSIRY